MLFRSDKQHITWNNITRHHLCLSPISLHKAVFRQHICNASHHPTGTPILPSIKARLRKKHSNKHNRQSQVGDGGIGITEWLPAYENENAADAEDASEAFEEVAEDLLSVVGWWGGVDVFAIFFELAEGAFYGKA